jgi:hypothetical protein
MNENAFMIAGTAIAIFGVGLYIWDSRKENVIKTYNNYRQVGSSKKKRNYKNTKTIKR